VPREPPASARASIPRSVRFDFDHLFATRPVLLAPMEDVSDAAFRRICRARGAELCVTEFVRAEHLVAGRDVEQRKIHLDPGDTPTAIQIYGADAALLVEAATIAERAEPAYIDINCGCWVPKVARGGAGAGWLREPDAMVAMARMIAERVSLPVTVKTRLGWGDEEKMPIVDLARRLEDVGVRAIAIHCRTAKMGHAGRADWSWARRAREVVSIPVIVNGDVASASDAATAIELTGCAGVMIGRRAIEHPWIFREARARLDRGSIAPPTPHERIALCREHLLAACDERGPRRAVRALRRYYPGYLRGVPGATILVKELVALSTIEPVLAALDRAATDLGDTPELTAACSAG
jgi:tRNA-dihydrouridine synthase B